MLAHNILYTSIAPFVAPAGLTGRIDLVRLVFGADVALSMNVVAWNGAIAAAGVVGGALLETWGAGAFPWAMVALLVLAFVIAWSASAHGFRPGRRSGSAPVARH